MNFFQAIVIAIVQGATELFPISSLGHAVVLPALLGWRVTLHDAAFLPFLTLLHIGTGIALLVYFRNDWAELLKEGLSRHGTLEHQTAHRLFWLVVLGTAPAVVLGGGFENFFRSWFSTPELAAIFLVINGIMLIVGEKLVRPGTRTLADLTWQQALLIGFSQAAALFPGISRSGVTMLSGLGTGLTHKDAAKFSFLLATPVIFAATAYEVYKLYQSGLSITMVSIAGMAVAGIVAYAAVWFLMRYFGRHEVKALNPFGWYCIAFGGLSLAWMVLA